MPAIVDPFQGFSFTVEIPKIEKGREIGFTKVSGLGEETEVVEYREGNEPPRMRKLRGLTSYSNVTLERGVDIHGVMRIWRDQIANAILQGRGDISEMKTIRNDVIIRLVDPANGTSTLRKWTLTNAWPNIKNIEDLDSGTSDVLIESIELAHEGLKEIINP